MIIEEATSKEVKSSSSLVNYLCKYSEKANFSLYIVLQSLNCFKMTKIFWSVFSLVQSNVISNRLFSSNAKYLLLSRWIEKILNSSFLLFLSSLLNPLKFFIPILNMQYVVENINGFILKNVVVFIE